MTPNPLRQNFDYDTRASMLEKLKRKQEHRRKMAMFQSFLKIALTDPLADSITPIPYSPAEPAPIGMLDGIYPQEDRESKPISSLDYGVLETHMTDDGNFASSSFDKTSPADNLEYFKQRPSTFLELIEECVMSGRQNMHDSGEDPDTKEGQNDAILSAEMMAFDKAKEHNQKHPNHQIDGNELAAAVRSKMIGSW